MNKPKIDREILEILNFRAEVLGLDLTKEK